MYSSILTTTSILRLGVALTVIVGGVLALRLLVDERARLLEQESQRVRSLEDLATLRNDFTSMVAHELSNPLAAITVMSDMLATGDLPVSDQERVARSIRAETEVLRNLVRDVSASAEVERDDFRVSPRPVALDALIADAAAYARTLSGNHPLRVEGDTGMTVLADPERIGQVLRNLLRNAARHTPAGTPIALRARREGAQAVLEVADSGPGIAPRDLANIFEKFVRGTSARVGGTQGRGLGLYLSRGIVRAHGSELAVTSAPGEGATFRFTLPEAP